jgi:UPF0755 protein
VTAAVLAAPGRRARLLFLLLLLAACGGEPHGSPVRFTVPAGSGAFAVADTLAARKLVGSSLLFRLYAQARGAAGSLHPGVYEVRPGTSWPEILRKLTRGEVVKLSLVVPEGWSAERIAERVASASGAPEDSVRRLLLGDSAAARHRVPGPTLEGYLYPATYVFPVGTPAPEMIDAMVRRYRQVWTPRLRALADSAGLSEREVVALASIVETEAKHWEERDTIAAVYRNRLRIGMPLQADPTVQYALGGPRTRLLYSQIRDVAENPYNTYTHRGLPPGPIASPSEGSIRAVLSPARVGFLYFVARPDGHHIFTRSLKEHNAATRRVARMRADSGGPAPARP